MAAAVPSMGAASIHDGGFMRILFGVMVVLAAAMATPADANPWRGGMHVQMQRPQPERFQRPPQRDFQRPPPERNPRDGRMTDQERRELHRDLDRANRELYKDRR
jgi:hypothetical protein